MNFNWKKIGRLSIMILAGLFSVAVFLATYVYYQTKGKYDVNSEKYSKYIGFLSNSDDTSKFERCDPTKPFGWYASAATYGPVYKGNKKKFKAFIQKNYIDSNYSENGFVNLRFIINCKGEVGNMKVQELDPEYRPIHFSPGLVSQIVKLSSMDENWIISSYDNNPMDAYMYLIFKIEDGSVTEILP